MRRLLGVVVLAACGGNQAGTDASLDAPCAIAAARFRITAARAAGQAPTAPCIQDDPWVLDFQHDGTEVIWGSMRCSVLGAGPWDLRCNTPSTDEVQRMVAVSIDADFAHGQIRQMGQAAGSDTLCELDYTIMSIEVLGAPPPVPPPLQP